MNYISFLFSHHYVHIIFVICSKKMELRLIVVSVLLKIKFGHAQISVSKIGIPMSKTTCINPWNFLIDPKVDLLV